MGDRGWGEGPGPGDEWARRAQPRRPVARGPAPRDRREEAADRGRLRRGPPEPEQDAVYTGPRYPQEMVGYGARRDATDPRGYRSGVRMAIPTSGWTIADGFPTIPTVLIGGAVVVLAFIMGRATGGGGGGSAAVTSQTTTTVVTTTTLLTTHTVAVGESLSSIAGIFGLSTQVLAAYNNISNVNHVFVGEVLMIPPPSTATTVAAGPTTKKK